MIIVTLINNQENKKHTHSGIPKISFLNMTKINDAERILSEMQPQTIIHVRDKFFVLLKFNMTRNSDEQIIQCLSDPVEYQKLFTCPFSVLFPKVFESESYLSLTQKELQQQYSAKCVNHYNKKEAAKALTNALSELKADKYLLFAGGSIEIRSYLGPSSVDFISRMSNELTETEVLTEVQNFQKEIESIKNRIIQGSRGYDILQRVKIKQMEQAKEEQKFSPSTSKAEEQMDSIENEEQHPFQTKMQQKLIEKIANSILRYHKDVKIENGQYPVGNGLLLPQKSTRGVEKSLVELYQNLHENKSEIKAMILVNTNKRGEQISNELEISFGQISTSSKERQFAKFQRYLNSKNNKVKALQNQIDWKEEVSNRQVMLMHSNKFLQLLIHCDLQIEAFDLIVFDEINKSFPEHQYNQIMQSFYYNHKLRNQKPLPYILGFCSIESLFNPNSNPQQIVGILKSLCNMFNSNFQALSTYDMLEVQNQVLKKHVKGIYYEFMKPFSHYTVIEDALAFNQVLNQYLHVGSKDGAVSYTPHPKIFELKQFNPNQYITTISSENSQIIAQITLSDAKKILEAFLTAVLKLLKQFKITNADLLDIFQHDGQSLSQQLDSDEVFEESKTSNNQGENDFDKCLKQQVVSIQHMIKKDRYFSSHYKVDWVLLPFFDHLGETKIQGFKYFNRNIIDLESVDITAPSSYIFKKKLESEDYVMLEMVYHLYSKGFIDEHLRPNEKKINGALSTTYSDIDETTSYQSYQGNSVTKSISQDTYRSFSTIDTDNNERNFKNLKFFIDKILNPIMQSTVKESIVSKGFLNQKILKEKNRIFAIYENFAKDLFIERQLNELASYIDGSVQHITLPQYMTQHLKESEVNKFKGEYFLYVLIIALSNQEFEDPKYEAINQEINRLQFLGEQASTLNIVTFLFLTKDKSFSENDLNLEKIEIFEKSFEKQGHKYNIRSILMDMSLYCPERTYSKIIKGLVGFISLYINPDASLLFLQELKIIQWDSSQEPLHIYLERQRSNKYADSPDLIKHVLYQVNNGLGQLQNPQIQFNTVELEKFVENITQNYQKIYQESANETSSDHNLASTSFTGVKEYSECLDGASIDNKNSQQSALRDNFNEESKEYTDFKQLSDITNAIMYESPDNNYSHNGYKFNNNLLLVQAFTHRSFSEKLANSLQDSRSQPELNVINYRKSFNYQRLEYLGDPILNFTVAKLFYLETIEGHENWHQDYYPSMKLHDLKTWFTSNNWLGFLMFEQAYNYNVHSKKFNIQAYKEAVDKQVKSSDKDDIAKAMKMMPILPLLYDDENDTFHKQIQKYQYEVSRRLASLKMMDTNSKLSLSGFRTDNEDDETINLQDLQDSFVKYFADVFEALIGAIFLDSGNFNRTSEIVLQLLKSHFVEFFPLKENERTKVLTVWNSKPYASKIKISHASEDRENESVLRGYMHNMEVRRVKFSKKQKKKIPNLYRDLRKYLEVAYYKFELESIGKELTGERFLEFNRQFRRLYNIKDKFEEQGIIKNVANYLCNEYSEQERNKFMQSNEENLKKDLIDVFKKLNHSGTISMTAKTLIELEHERVRVTKVRQILSKAGIKSFIQYYSGTIEQFFMSLNLKQHKSLLESLWNYGEKESIGDKNPIDKDYAQEGQRKDTCNENTSQISRVNTGSQQLILKPDQQDRVLSSESGQSLCVCSEETWKKQDILEGQSEGDHQICTCQETVHKEGCPCKSRNQYQPTKKDN